MADAAASTTLLGIDRRVLALAVARMADAMGNSFLIIVLPLYISSDAVAGDAFGLSTSLVIGVVLALFGLASSLAQPFAGHLSDRTGQRKAFVWMGLLAFSVTNVAFVWADSYTLLFGLRIVQGLSAAFTITASIALVNEVSEPASRGGNMGVYNAFRLVGFGAGPIAASVLVEAGPFPLGALGTVTGYQAAFYIASGAALVSAVLVMLLVRDPTGIPAPRDRLSIAVWDPRRKGLDAIFALGLVTLTMAACFALLSAIEPTVNARLDQGPIAFAVEFVALIAVLALVQPLVGRASDKQGRRRFIVLGLVGLVPTTLLQGLVVEPWQMVVVRGLQGVAGAMIFAPALALAGDLADRGRSGAQLSVLTISFGLGIAIGQLIAGFFVQFGFVVPFAVGAVLATVGLGLVLTQVPAPHPARA
jgi:MFS family permease